MFGLKLKSWMEAHLGRPRHKSTSHQNQKRAPKDSASSSASNASATTSAAASGSSASSSCSNSVCGTAASTATFNSVSSSSTNTSASNGSTTTAIVGVTTSNNPSFSNDVVSNTSAGIGTTGDQLPHHQYHHQEKNSNFQSVTTSSSSVVGISPSTVVAGSESVTVLPTTGSTTVEGPTLQIKNEGDNIISKQNVDASGTRGALTEAHGSGESDHLQAPGNGNNNDCNSRPSVTTSVSNSTSILSGYFSASLSSPDTGYSTDGYSPKSVYPALSFDSSSTASSSTGNCKSTTSTSKSSYTISSLASNELLHPSKQTSSSLLSSTGESVHNDLDEYGSVAPSPSSPAALTSSNPFSQSCSSGISTGTSDSGCNSNSPFPKGQHQVHHHQHLENSPLSLVQHRQHQQQQLHHQLEHSIAEDDNSKKQQVIIIGTREDVDGGVGGQKNNNKTCLQVELSQQNLSPSSAALSTSKLEKVTSTSSSLPISTLAAPSATTGVVDPLAKFAQFSIDFKNQDVVIPIPSKHNGRTHRRAESMDARTPSHEDYKPLVQDEDGNKNGFGGLGTNVNVGGNPSLVMTEEAQTKNSILRTPFALNTSGHLVEFASYKNAYSICSPRRERTRIKTNPWITVNNKSGNGNDKLELPLSHVNNNNTASQTSVGEGKTSSAKTSTEINDENSSFASAPPATSSSSLSKPLEIGISSKSSPSETKSDAGNKHFGGGSESRVINIEKGNHSTVTGRDISVNDSSNINFSIDSSKERKSGSKINNKMQNEVIDQQLRHGDNFVGEDDERFVEEDETGIIDHDQDHASSTSSLLYRFSTSASASDSGKGTLEPTTNRNSTESSCLLSDSTTASARNSIISQETEQSSGCSRSIRSSSGDSISSSRHHPVEEEDMAGHASPVTSCADNTAPRLFTGEKRNEQHQHIHQRVNVGSNTSFHKESIPGTTTAKKVVSTSTSTESDNNNFTSGELPRTFRNAAVATDSCPEVKFPKSESVSVGVGTTSSNKSGKFQHQTAAIMVDKETDILSDWGNTDEDGDEEIETDGDRNDNETVTPAPSSPGTDVDRALFSQSTSSATDIDFGDSSAATQASSTAVFPPSSLIRSHHRFSSGGNSHNTNGRNSGTGGNRENGARFHYNSSNDENGFSNGNGGGEALLSSGEMVQGSYDHQNHYQHNINMSLQNAAAMAAAGSSGVGACYPSVPIIGPVLAAAAQHQGPNGIPDAFTYDIAAANTGSGVFLNHMNQHNHHHHTFHHPRTVGEMKGAMCFTGGVPNFNLDEDDEDYPQIKESHKDSHKGIARGAIGFLRKIFKKGTCSSQRHSPDSIKGKKSRGKSDNNLASLGLGSPLLTISEPLSNPRYSAVLTTKKQINPALNGYFLTPTPNSFRRRSGTGTDSSDSKSSNKHSSGKSIKTDIIRLPPQGTLSLQQQQQLQIMQQQRHATSSSHSSGSSSTCSGFSTTGIPQQTCSMSTFLSPGSANFQQHPPGMPVVVGSAAGGNNSHLPSSQSNTDSASASSSIHSLMSTSTSASVGNGNNGIPNLNRPPSQNQSRTPILPARDSINYYANANSSPACRQSVFIANNNGNGNNITRGNGNSHSMSPPPLIPENSPYLNDGINPQHHKNTGNSNNAGRRDQHSHLQSPSLKGRASFESPRPGHSSATGSAGSAVAASTRMNSPSFNNYSPIHRLVVTGGTHLISKGSNPNCPNGNSTAVNPAASTGLMHYPQTGSGGEEFLPLRNSNNNSQGGFPMNSQIVNRPGSHHNQLGATSSSPLINHRYPSTSSPHQYPHQSSISSSQQQQNVPGHFFASPSPILRNPRYQYITSSNQNSPILNGTKHMNNRPPSSHSHVQIHPGNSGNGPLSNNIPSGPPPLLTTFAPLPSSSLSSSLMAPRESLINNNSYNTNTITGSPNLNSSTQRTRQVVSSSLSYNEFENVNRHQNHQNFLILPNNGTGNNNSNFPLTSSHQHQHPSSSFHHHHQQSISPPQHQLLHQSHKGKIHHQNHYYSSPIVKGAHLSSSLGQTLWNPSEDQGRMSEGSGRFQHQTRMNQNLRFNSFLVRHRQLPQFYPGQWGESIYESVDSDGEQTASDEMSGAAEIGRTSELSLPAEVHYRRMQQEQHSHIQDDHLRMQEGNFLQGQREANNMHDKNAATENVMMSGETQQQPQAFKLKSNKRAKPKSLSVRPPRPEEALPMLSPFLSETEKRLLDVDNESDRKYKRLINEASALLKEISVEKSKRSGAPTHDNNTFRLEECPSSDPLRRKNFDWLALRKLQQIANCMASPPVLHRSRLNLQSPLTPTVTNNPFISHFQQVNPQMSSARIVDNNQNSFRFGKFATVDSMLLNCM